MNGDGSADRKVGSHRDLEVYKRAFGLAMSVFEVTKSFPREETYSLTDQIRRSSRSVCANLAEAWRKRRYQAAFIGKLSDAETEAAETQVWLEFAVKCGYLEACLGGDLYRGYDGVVRSIVGIIANAASWVMPSGRTGGNP